ncbi:MAG: heavy-metal-associated domain-containing protein [Nannocystaceae bacterium]
MHNIRVRIQNMTCGGCVRGVVEAVHQVDLHTSVEASPETRLVVLATKMPTHELLAGLRTAGFSPEVLP